MMFFGKRKKKEIDDFLLRDDVIERDDILENLMSVCGDGAIDHDAFVLADEGIYIYADLLSLRSNVVQIMFQLHHAWLDEPLMEAVAASGESAQEACRDACRQFYEQVLAVYLKGVRGRDADDRVEGFTQERHRFYMYRSGIAGIGKREGLLQQDFWDMLKEQLCLRLGNKRVYWIKVFASRSKDDVECEVRINGREAGELGKKLLPYAIGWDCISSVYTERQWILLIQDEDTFEESDITLKEIAAFTQKTIPLFEECETKEDYQRLRRRVCTLCKDESLAYELLSFLPELYCRYSYPQVEFGEKLFLVQKDQKTKELYQSQLRSFAVIDACVRKHLEEERSEEGVRRVLAYSVNAKAIENAVKQGDELSELAVPGIGYVGGRDYILR